MFLRKQKPCLSSKELVEVCTLNVVTGEWKTTDDMATVVSKYSLLINEKGTFVIPVKTIKPVDKPLIIKVNTNNPENHTPFHLFTYSATDRTAKHVIVADGLFISRRWDPNNQTVIEEKKPLSEFGKGSTLEITIPVGLVAKTTRYSLNQPLVPGTVGIGDFVSSQGQFSIYEAGLYGEFRFMSDMVRRESDQGFPLDGVNSLSGDVVATAGNLAINF